MTDAPLTCHYCQRPLGDQTYDYRPHPSSPLYVFCTPDCRTDFADGYGLTAVDWTPDEAPAP